ncbi:MAG TPA: hypothetical protein VG389_14535 [Myxococcota bacterium]|nr:hypothetical protein [Myxococcota bacterium]
MWRAAGGEIRAGAAPRAVDPLAVAAAGGDTPLPRHLGLPAADLVTSRGCEARCAYCCVAATSDGLRREGVEPYARVSPEELADLVATLVSDAARRAIGADGAL